MTSPSSHRPSGRLGWQRSGASSLQRPPRRSEMLEPLRPALVAERDKNEHPFQQIAIVAFSLGISGTAATAAVFAHDIPKLSIPACLVVHRARYSWTRPRPQPSSVAFRRFAAGWGARSSTP